MIYKFKSAVAGDVIMLGPTGDRVLGLIGKAVAPQGIIEPADMPAAIQALADAVAADEAARAAAGTDPDAPKPEAISLRQRTWPLTQMMRRAHDADEPIVWGI
ncbi:MAG: DUF1840 domain-containing protein [Vitreoscilla sp.]|nr:DUF1840 domain-containing protein [Vitreoscilla sp.]